MPTGKRKRSHTDQTRPSSKRNSESPQRTSRRKNKLEADDKYYETAAILAEDPLKKEYLIRWKGRLSNRKLHEDSWEPYDYVLPETIKEWKIWKRSNRLFKRRPDSDFEKLPYPGGWHLKGSPVQTQSSELVDSQIPDPSIQLKTTTPDPSEHQKKRLRVVDSSPSPNVICSASTPPLEGKRPAGQAHVLINIPSKAPPGNTKLIIPDSQSQRADSSHGPVGSNPVLEEPAASGTTPITDSQDIDGALSESQATFSTTQSSLGEGYVGGETLLQPTQWEIQQQSNFPSSAAQEAHEAVPQNIQGTATPYIGETFLRPKRALPEIPLESPNQLVTGQQPQLSASLLSSPGTGGPSRQEITETPAAVVSLSRLYPLEETDLCPQEHSDSAFHIDRAISSGVSQTQNPARTTDSSSLPDPPSQSLEETLDSLAPPRPQTPLDVEMSTRSSAAQTPNRDLLDSRSPRSARRSPRPADATSQQSTSSTQANEARHALNSSITVTNNSQNGSITTENSKEYSELQLPIQMTGEQIPWCPRVIKEAFVESKAIRDFVDYGPRTLEGEGFGQELASLFDVLSRIEDHADLIRPDESQASQVIPLEGRVAWNRRASSKIVLLEAILDPLKEADKTIAVLARPGTFANMIKDALALDGIDWIHIAETTEMQPPKSSPLVLLLTADCPKVLDYLDRIDLVLDLAPKSLHDLNQLRAKLAPRITALGRPAIFPVPICSISHFMCTSLDQDLKEATRRRLALSKFDPRPDHLGDWVRLCGKLPRGMPDVRKLGALIGTAVRGGLPFTDLPRLESIALPTNTSTLTSTNASRAASPAGQKRGHGQVGTSSTEADSKKPRLFDHTGTLLSNSDESPKADQGKSNLQSTAPADFATRVTDSTALVNSQTEGPSSLSFSHSQARSSAQRQMALERTQFAAQEEALAALQTRFEAIGAENGVLQRKVAAAAKIQTAAEARAQKLQTMLDTLKEERAAMRAEVEQTRASLASSTVADLQELAALREKAARVDSLEKQLTSQKETNEYITLQYRAASDGAVKEASLNVTLKEENEQLKKRADEQTTELRKLFEKESVAAAHDEVKKQTQQVRFQNRLLERLANANEALLERVKELEDREEARHGMAGATRSGSRAQTPRASSLGPGQSSQGHGVAKSGLGPESAALRAVLEGNHGRGGAAMSRGNSRQGSPAHVAGNGGANGGPNGGGRGPGNAPIIPSHLRD